ncbi:DUF2795 domain-containing protein [Marinactinospora thermotolerans]|uniref:DUF2795 domain-containing protein n=1 Tax=Marinactinospora thermotolerans DSM 45154 TaxID=1122192 RepID=A0A1T4K7M2_9ACTN|nr:DUF2795 domain-containing protein [Marinactinospora thermotolerans]SJZ38422.1 Protein of unknown function [Marinactinospora thermotolerans DSM 45154]
MAQAEFITVQKALSGIDYPAAKKDLQEHAKRHKADQHVLDVLGRIPDQRYGGPDEVSKAVAEAARGKG